MHKPTGPEPPLAGATLTIGRWRVDPRADEIEADGRVVKLEPLKMRLLMALAERPAEVLLTQELLDGVWGGLIVTSSSVYQGIAQLRRLLGDNADDPEYIQTVPRKGYRLVAPVRRLEKPNDDAVAAAAPAARPTPPAAPEAPVVPAVPSVPQVPDVPEAPLADPGPPVALPAAPAAVGVPPGLASPGRRGWFFALTAAGVAGVAGLAGWRFIESRPPASPVRIAVLPFADRSKGLAEQALSQGLAFDVIRAFGRYPDVDIVAPESALAVGDAAGSLGQVAQRLQVAFVLLGEVVRAGARLHVAVRLLALPGARVRWQREFEQAVEGLPALPQQIAHEAAAALHLAPPRVPARAEGPSEAYEFYVLGEHARRPKTPEAFAKARNYFERGIEIDPAYARNYIGLGWAWLGQATNGAGIDMPEAVARATPLFDKALRLEPESPEGLTAQGVLHVFGSRFDEARQLFERALKLSPGYAQAHHSYGVAEYEDGWPQRAARHFERAAELNPLSLSPLDRLGLAQVASGRFGDADRAYRRAIEIEPQHPNGYWGLGIKGYAQGDLGAAVSGYREALKREARRPFLWDQLGWLYLDLGLPQPAAQAFETTAAQLPPGNRWPAIHAAYAWVSQPDRGAVPAALALTPQQVPEDAFAIDVMLLRAMAGLALDDALLQRALEIERSRGRALQPGPWFVFEGRHALLDLAAVYAAMGQPERGRPQLDEAQQQLDRLQRQGNVWHALHLHRARLHALRGEPGAALDALDAAVAAGSRRGWWLRLDPAFAALREDTRFKAALARIEADMARQRALLPG